MVVSHQIGDPLYIFGVHTQLGQHGFGIGRPHFFLKRTGAGTVLLFRRAYAYIVYQSGALGQKLSVGVQLFHVAYELSQTVHLDEMLYTHGVALVESYHLLFKQIYKI